MEKIFSSNFIGTHGRELWRFFYEATLRSYGNVNLNKEGPNDETSCETNANDDGSNTIVFEKATGAIPISILETIRLAVRLLSVTVVRHALLWFIGVKSFLTPIRPRFILACNQRLGQLNATTRGVVQITS